MRAGDAPGQLPAEPRRGRQARGPAGRAAVAAVALAAAFAADARGQAADTARTPRLELYGWVQTDAGYDFGAIDPRYADRLRVSALPSADGEFGPGGQTFFSVRQSRGGFRAHVPSGRGGEILVQLEMDLTGSGDDAGKTVPRLRHAYGELGPVGAGQYWSPFVDPDAAPAIFESFGPIGLPRARNVQLRVMPLRGATRITLAVEKPGASAEGGDYADLVELEDVRLRFRTPEWAASVRREGGWGHVQAAGLLRRVWWDDLVEDDVDLSGDATGWGVSLTSALRFGAKNVVRLQYLAGEGVENYLNDGTADVAPRPDPGRPERPVKGVALPVRSVTGYAEVYRGRWGAVGGYSLQAVDNAAGQSATAFARGDYATFTAVYVPVAGLTAAAEYQYGRRRSADGFASRDHRLQLTLRYAFSADLVVR